MVYYCYDSMSESYLFIVSQTPFKFKYCIAVYRLYLHSDWNIPSHAPFRLKYRIALYNQVAKFLLHLMVELKPMKRLYLLPSLEGADWLEY